MESKSLTTPAKVNLYLRITGKRPDGYHEIETLFYPVLSLFDTITICEAPGLCVECSAPGVPADERNLVWKAAKAYADSAGITPVWKIKIKKNIPVAAGLGGGSSDAAATLRLLQQEYASLNKEKLVEIAAKLGADVPFFLEPLPAIGRGIGEILEPVELPPDIPVKIHAPGFPVSAAWAYRHAKPAQNPPDINEIIVAFQKQDLEKAGELLHNDLAPALYEKFPYLRILKEELSQNSFGAEITGSGPTLFSIH